MVAISFDKVLYCGLDHRAGRVAVLIHVYHAGTAFFAFAASQPICFIAAIMQYRFETTPVLSRQI